MRRMILVLLALCAGAKPGSAQDFAISTNVLDYANLGTINLQASYAVSRHWSVNAGMKYNPFSYGSGEEEARSRQLSYSAGARFWPWHSYSGWWLSGALRYQEYNHGGFVSRETSEGDRFGGILGGGYTYMLNKHMNIDVGVGVWLGYDRFTTYACQTCGRIIADGGKYFVKPGDIMLALTYIF